MSSTINRHGGDDGDVEVERGHPLIPDGEYVARFNGHDCVEMTSFKDKSGSFPQKAILSWTIIEGPYAGTKLFRAYRVKHFYRKSGRVGTPIKNGRFKLAARSQLLKDICRALDVKVRPDRLSLRSMKQYVWTITTRTVIHGMENGRQTELPVALRYSVVASFRRETGS